MAINVDYPEEWNELPKRERKQKIRELKKQDEKKDEFSKKVKSVGIAFVVIVVLVGGYKLVTQKSPEEVAFQEEVKEVSLQDKVEEFEIEGAEHVAPETEVEYKTNPPTSGSHYGTPTDWGVYSEEISDEATVHSLEHGGTWISYKDISDEEKQILEEIGRSNPQSVVVSPRAANDNKVAVVSWGRMMKLEAADRALIQKYIDTYKNQSPEKLAR
jgi:hypothetical protein